MKVNVDIYDNKLQNSSDKIQALVPILFQACLEYCCNMYKSFCSDNCGT